MVCIVESLNGCSLVKRCRMVCCRLSAHIVVMLAVLNGCNILEGLRLNCCRLSAHPIIMFAALKGVQSSREIASIPLSFQFTYI